MFFILPRPFCTFVAERVATFNVQIYVSSWFSFQLVQMNASFHLLDLFIVSHAHLLYCINISVEVGPRYKPPRVSRGSPALHCLLLVIITIVYFEFVT